MNTATAHVTQVGTRVNFVSLTGLCDHSMTGTVTEWPAIHPSGVEFRDLLEVTWDDGEVEVLSIDDVCIEGAL